MCKVGINGLADNNQHQIDEALGSDNRYFANQFYDRKLSKNDLVMYYITHGGAEGHRKRVEQAKLELERIEKQRDKGE